MKICLSWQIKCGKFWNYSSENFIFHQAWSRVLEQRKYLKNEGQGVSGPGLRRMVSNSFVIEEILYFYGVGC